MALRGSAVRIRIAPYLFFILKSHLDRTRKRFGQFTNALTTLDASRNHFGVFKQTKKADIYSSTFFELIYFKYPQGNSNPRRLREREVS